MGAYGSGHVGEIAACGTAVLWTVSAIAWTHAGRDVGSTAVGFLRLLLAAFMFMAYGWLVRGMAWPADASERHWLFLGLSGFLGFFVCDLCLFESFLLIGPRRALMVLSLTPPCAAILSWAFCHRLLLPMQWLAMLVTLGGVLWVILEQRSEHERGIPGLSPRLIWWGVALAVVATCTNAAAAVIANEGIGQYDAVAAGLLRTLGAIPGYIVFVSIAGLWPSVAAAPRNRRAMGVVVFGTFAGTFAGVVLYMIAMAHSSAGVVSTILATMPVLILPFTVFVDREKLSLRAAAGACIALAGVGMLVSAG